MKLFTNCVVYIFALIYSPLYAQDSSTSNYVTIGVFRVLDNAVRFTENANKNGFAAQYALNPKYNLYYVYLLDEKDKMKAYIFLSKVRKESDYKDAWIFVGSLGAQETLAKTEPKLESKIEVVPESKVEPKVPPKAVDTIAVVHKEPDVVKPEKDTAVMSAPVIDSSAVKEETPVIAKKKGKPFYFKVVSKSDGKELFGNIQLQEAVGAKQYRLIKSGEITYVEAPVNKKGAYGISAQIPGYKQSTFSFDYADPKGEKGSQNEDVITFTLEKAGKGDYADFNNVHFLKNTSIMQPQSQKELDALVSMMKENPKYKIKIFGFVNGKKSRETITMGTSTNFFALDNKANKRGTLSSKELSSARAETVKAYLVQQGIDGGRVSTKGEGGAVPLYDEGGNLGYLNDRIEVEFVKSK